MTYNKTLPGGLPTGLASLWEQKGRKLCWWLNGCVWFEVSHGKRTSRGKAHVLEELKRIQPDLRSEAF